MQIQSFIYGEKDFAIGVGVWVVKIHFCKTLMELLDGLICMLHLSLYSVQGL